MAAAIVLVDPTKIKVGRGWLAGERMPPGSSLLDL